MINQYKTRTIICKGCGKKITKRMPKERKYCSIGCYRKSERPQRKTGKIIKCGWCGKEIYKRKIHLKHKNSFCSIKCANKYQGRNRIIFICKMCGKNFSWSKSRTKKYTPLYCSLECRNKDPQKKEMLRNLNILQQTMKPNNLEKKGYAILKSLNLIFKKQLLIGNKFLVDAFVPKYNLIIQFDGNYWHGNPNKYKILSDRQKKRKIIDKSQNAYFKKCGFNLLRIWESEINQLKERLENDYLTR